MRKKDLRLIPLYVVSSSPPDMPVVIDDIFNRSGSAELVEYVIDDCIDGCTTPASERIGDKIENVKRLRVGHIESGIVSKDPDGSMIALS